MTIRDRGVETVRDRGKGGAGGGFSKQPLTGGVHKYKKK
jgi:hypothetical protein